MGRHHHVEIEERARTCIFECWEFGCAALEDGKGYEAAMVLMWRQCRDFILWDQDSKRAMERCQAAEWRRVLKLLTDKGGDIGQAKALACTHVRMGKKIEPLQQKGVRNEHHPRSK